MVVYEDIVLTTSRAWMTTGSSRCSTNRVSQRGLDNGWGDEGRTRPSPIVNDSSSGGAGESIRDRSVVSRAQEEFDAEYDLPSTEWFQTFGSGGAKVSRGELGEG